MMTRTTELLMRLEGVFKAFLLLCLIPVVWWAFDREPPFHMISATTNTPRPGEILEVRAVVRRDLDRDCSVTFSRYLFDAAGFRHESTGPQIMTPYALKAMDAMAPGKLNVRMRVPTEFPVGKGTFTTVLVYRCNPLQDLFRPIELEMNVPFEVVPN